MAAVALMDKTREIPAVPKEPQHAGAEARGGGKQDTSQPTSGGKKKSCFSEPVHVE